MKIYGLCYTTLYRNLSKTSYTFWNSYQDTKFCKHLLCRLKWRYVYWSNYSNDVSICGSIWQVIISYQKDESLKLYLPTVTLSLSLDQLICLSSTLFLHHYHRQNYSIKSLTDLEILETGLSFSCFEKNSLALINHNELTTS